MSVSGYPPPDPISIQWQPPNLFDFTLPDTTEVCKIAIEFQVAYINAFQNSDMMEDGNTDNIYSSDLTPIVPIDTVLEYMVTAFSFNDPSSLSKVTNGTLLDLYTDQFAYTYEALVFMTPESCLNANYICPALDWTGDGDVSGIGMIIAYYMVAVMTTGWFLAVLYANFTAKGLAKKRHPAVHAIMTGFQESVPIFLDAALIFAISMVIAAITRYAMVKHDPNGHYQIYALIGSIFMSTYSILPAVVLQTITDVKKHLWLRLSLWFLIIPFAITLDALYRQLYKSQNWTAGLDSDMNTNSHFVNSTREQGEIVWLEWCDPPGQRQRLETLLTVTHIFLAFNAMWWLYHVLLATLPREWKRAVGERFSGLRKFGKDYSVFKVLLAIDGLAGFVLMWLSLALYHKYRNAVKSVAGDANTDTEWTFGQVMAVATWVPVFVDYASAVFYDSKHDASLSPKPTMTGEYHGGYTGVNQPESQVMLDKLPKHALVDQNSFYDHS